MKKRMKKVIALILGMAVMAGALAGCGTGKSEEPVVQDNAETDAAKEDAEKGDAEDSGSAQGSAEKLSVGFLCYTEEAEYHYKVLTGCKEAFEAAGYDFTYAVTGQDAAACRAAYDSFVTKGVNCIIDFTVSSTSAAALSDLCEEAGIYYIAVDVFFPEIDTNSYTYSFGVNNQEIGEYGGENAVKWLKDHQIEKVDYILEMNNLGFGESVRARTLGVRDAILNGGFGLTEDQTYYMDITATDQTEVKQLVQDHLTSVANQYETIVLLVCSSEWDAAALSAVEAAGLQDRVIMFENDGSATGINILKSVHDGAYQGTCPMKGSVAFFPEKYAEMLLPIAEKLVAGEQVQKYNYTLKGYLTSDNVYEVYPE